MLTFIVIFCWQFIINKTARGSSQWLQVYKSSSVLWEAEVCWSHNVTEEVYFQGTVRHISYRLVFLNIHFN